MTFWFLSPWQVLYGLCTDGAGQQRTPPCPSDILVQRPRPVPGEVGLLSSLRGEAELRPAWGRASRESACRSLLCLCPPWSRGVIGSLTLCRLQEDLRGIFLGTKQLLLLSPRFSVFFLGNLPSFGPRDYISHPSSKSFHYSSSKWKPLRL